MGELGQDNQVIQKLNSNRRSPLSTTFTQLIWYQDYSTLYEYRAHSDTPDNFRWVTLQHPLVVNQLGAQIPGASHPFAYGVKQCLFWLAENCLELAAQFAPAPKKTRRQNHIQYSAQWEHAAQSPSDDTHSLCWTKKRASGVHLLAMSFTLSLRVFLSHLFLALGLCSPYICVYIYICVCKYRRNANASMFSVCTGTKSK